jgi:hypothetical protein
VPLGATLALKISRTASYTYAMPAVSRTLRNDTTNTEELCPAKTSLVARRPALSVHCTHTLVLLLGLFVPGTAPPRIFADVLVFCHCAAGVCHATVW